MQANERRGIALITGGTSGIGAACARALEADGWKVYVAARSNRGGADNFITLDVTDETAAARAAAKFAEREQRLDVLIHAAGMGIAGAAEDTPDEDAHRQMETNYFGVLRVGRHFMPLMRRGGGGNVIVIGSVAGLVAVPFQSHYSSSKYALEAYVEALRMEAKPLGIRAMLIEPGDTRTGFTQARHFSLPEGSPYAQACRKAVAVMERDEQNGVSPDTTAVLAARYAGRKRLPVRKVVGLQYKALALLRRVLPAWLGERLVAMTYRG